MISFKELLSEVYVLHQVLDESIVGLVLCFHLERILYTWQIVLLFREKFIKIKYTFLKTFKLLLFFYFRKKRTYTYQNGICEISF